MIKIKYISFFLLLLIISVFLGCISSKYEIFVNQKNFKKKLLPNHNFTWLKKKSLKYNLGETAVGYFFGIKQQIKVTSIPDVPNIRLKCINSQNQILWSHPTLNYPNNLISFILIEENSKESRVLILGPKGEYLEKYYTIDIIDEKGYITKTFELEKSFSFTGEDFGYFSSFTWKNEKYLAVTTFGNEIKLFNFNGDLIKSLKTIVTHAVSIAGIAINNRTNKSYLVIAANHRTSTNSSVIFFLDDNWNVIYKELLPNLSWIAKRKYNKEESLIVSTHNGDSWEYEF